jgi:hypothetical protein
VPVSYDALNRAVLVDQVQQAAETVEKLLTLLQSAPIERDRFVSHNLSIPKRISANL